MFRTLSLLVAGVALMLAAPQVQAAKGDWKILLLGGVAVPTGSFEKDFFGTPDGLGAKVGFSGGPEFDYLVGENLALGLDGHYTRNSLNSRERDEVRNAGDPTFDIKYSQIGGGAHLRYWFPSQSSVGTYIVAGIGITNFKAEGTSSVLGSESHSKTGFAARGGLGASYHVGETFSLGLQADFNYAKLDEATFFSKSATTFGVKAVLAFDMSARVRQ